MISKDEVQHIAKLARVHLSAKEVEKFQHELSAILDFVGQLSEVDTSGVEPTRQTTGLESVLRKDENRNLVVQDTKELITWACKHKNGYLVIPETIKRKEEL